MICDKKGQFATVMYFQILMIVLCLPSESQSSFSHTTAVLATITCSLIRNFPEQCGCVVGSWGLSSDFGKQCGCVARRWRLVDYLAISEVALSVTKVSFASFPEQVPAGECPISLSKTNRNTINF